MEIIERYLIRAIAARAQSRMGRLAAELVEAPSGSREEVLAELEYRRWLSESCLECM